MLHFLFGFKWQKSQAHLLLLSKFIRPHTIEDYENSWANVQSQFWPSWTKVLGETPSKAINRFLDEGMLKNADIPKKLEWKYKIPDLKRMLKERNLPVSGNKGNLILRLIKADPNGMKEDVYGLNVLICSEKGRKIVDDYLAIEKEKWQNLNQQVLNALQKRKFKEASLLVLLFNAEQVFPTMLGADLRNPEHFSMCNTHDIAVLKIIFASNPKILKNLNKEWLEHLRLAAGMRLLGQVVTKDVIPPNLETGLVLDGIAAASMILRHAQNQERLAQLRELEGKLVEILGCDDGCICEACEEIAGKKFKIDEVPELPYEKCTEEMGCRCVYSIVID